MQQLVVVKVAVGWLGGVVEMVLAEKDWGLNLAMEEDLGVLLIVEEPVHTCCCFSVEPPQAEEPHCCNFETYVACSRVSSASLLPWVSHRATNNPL